ncbi:MAG: sugar phosphate isomerase/epimerase, partial [Gammaproteobacteria bacterium]|nr:sugar phosphate isomerase/epimerase [Gammaproteobacteria bacterium]
SPVEPKLEMGLMLYTARDLLAENPVAGLEFIARKGYQNIELIAVTGHPLLADPFFGFTAAEFNQLILDFGLKPVSSHCNPMEFLEPQLEVASRMGIEYLVYPIAPAFLEMGASGPSLKEHLQPSDCIAFADTLNTAGESCKAYGVKLAYHNHHAEFLVTNNQLPYELILSHTDPDLVSMELDVGWVAKAGMDPADVLARYTGRLSLCHFKDIDPKIAHTGQGEEFVTPGAGILDMARIKTAASEAGVRYCFVECDHPVDPMESIEQAALFL